MLFIFIFKNLGWICFEDILVLFKGRMSKEIQRLDIIFREPTATYKAGDTVSGFLQLDLGQELKLKGQHNKMCIWSSDYNYSPSHIIVILEADCAMYVCMLYMYACMYVWMYVCMCVYIVTFSPLGFRNPLRSLHKLTLLFHDCNQ